MYVDIALLAIAEHNLKVARIVGDEVRIAAAEEDMRQAVRRINRDMLVARIGTAALTVALVVAFVVIILA